jgi:ribonucleoside-diphosphate reductase alpha chain
MNKSQKILSDVVVFNKYAKYIPELGRRETWEEICERNMRMHMAKYPMLAEEIAYVFNTYVKTKKVLPSMRSMQFGGKPIEMNNTRMFNCCCLPVDSLHSFSETMFLLLGGSGVGYSVQQHHVEQLPAVKGPTSRRRRFVVGDSIEGWADAVKVVVRAYFEGRADPDMDYGDIRPKGARLITAGGKAPGPEPLRICIENIRTVLNGAIGRKLTPLECHDIQCHIADAVLSGGIRRAAMIAFFSPDDLDMITCKSGAWWELNPQRGRANNSVVLLRGTIDEAMFKAIWKRVEDSNAGEPGVYWTNDRNILSNPCVEATLQMYSFCNLTTINGDDVGTQKELNLRARAATFIGTLQAGFTNFHYLRSIWREVTEDDSLIGVSCTGIGSGKALPLDWEEAASHVVDENARVAAIIGVNTAARTSLMKPEGTASIVVGSSSGVHAWHNDFYIRRMRVGKNEALYFYMLKNFPLLVEDCKFKPHLEAVMSFPQKAPEGSILRTESFMDLLERVRRFNQEWIKPGHNRGVQRHNISCTISLKGDEWEACGDWMWKYRDEYNGISVLPYDGGTYVQAPFEDCSEDLYEGLMAYIEAQGNFDLTLVNEEDDNTAHTMEAACAGGQCEVTQ